jgi:hypothetical protein
MIACFPVGVSDDQYYVCFMQQRFYFDRRVGIHEAYKTSSNLLQLYCDQGETITPKQIKKVLKSRMKCLCCGREIIPAVRDKECLCGNHYHYLDEDLSVYQDFEKVLSIAFKHGLTIKSTYQKAIEARCNWEYTDTSLSEETTVIDAVKYYIFPHIKEAGLQKDGLLAKEWAINFLRNHNPWKVPAGYLSLESEE